MTKQIHLRKQNSKQNISPFSTCLKSSNHFSNESAKNNLKLNDVNSLKEKKCEKNQICDLSIYQPVTECIKSTKQDPQSNTLENQTNKLTKIQKELLRCNTKNSKLINIEKILNDNCDKNEIVSEITQDSRTRGVQRNANVSGSCPKYFNP